MMYINDIINQYFKTEKVLNISEIAPKYEFQKYNKYYKIESKKNRYFVKIKKELRLEAKYNEVLKPILHVPHIYRYSQTNDNSYEYIIEEYIDGISLHDMKANYAKHDVALFLAGQAFGRAFNIKNGQTSIDDRTLVEMNMYDKSIYNKYFSNNIYDGLILFDVDYLYSVVDGKDIISVIDLENCLYDDIRPYINTYEKIYGGSFVSGFNSSSNINYCDLIIKDMEEYTYIRKKVEIIEKNYPS